MDSPPASPGWHHSPARGGSRDHPFNGVERDCFPRWSPGWARARRGDESPGSPLMPGTALALDAMLSIEEMATLRPRQFDIVSAATCASLRRVNAPPPLRAPQSLPARSWLSWSLSPCTVVVCPFLPLSVSAGRVGRRHAFAGWQPQQRRLAAPEPAHSQYAERVSSQSHGPSRGGSLPRVAARESIAPTPLRQARARRPARARHARAHPRP